MIIDFEQAMTKKLKAKKYSNRVSPQQERLVMFPQQILIKNRQGHSFIKDTNGRMHKLCDLEDEPSKELTPVLHPVTRYFAEHRDLMLCLDHELIEHSRQIPASRDELQETFDMSKE